MEKEVKFVYERVDVAARTSLIKNLTTIVQRSIGNSKDTISAYESFLNKNLKDLEVRKEVLESLRYSGYEIPEGSIKVNSMAYLLKEAETIATGIEHNNILEKSALALKPLSSTFNKLNSHKNKRAGVYPLGSGFKDDQIRVPIEDVDGRQINVKTEDYARLIEKIEEVIDKNGEVLNSVSSLLNLMESLAINIPYSDEISDISLYDHSKIECAIASSLYVYSEDKGKTDYRESIYKSKEFRREDTYLLVSGDLSGIQDFIYTISSKGALRSLRGRSLYLEIMTESIIDDILAEVGLTRANLLYSGGGHFYMLLPNTERTRVMIEESKKTFNKQLLEMFSVALYLELDYIECSGNQLANSLEFKEGEENLIGEIYSGVSRKISKNKLQRYQSGEIEKLFDPDSDYNRKQQNERECIICGESDNLVPFQGRKENLACRSCNSLATLGTKVARTHGSEDKHLLVVREESVEGVRVPSIANRKYIDILPLEQVKKTIEVSENEYTRIYTINEPMHDLESTTNLWIGNYNRRYEDQKAMEFEYLASQSCGIKRLGVLRADVDDLGQAFTSGFVKKNDVSGKYDDIGFTRSAAFSREMSTFFKYEINKLCNGTGDTQFNFRLPGSRKDLSNREKNIVIVYAGGDDVFAVGPWDEILEFSVNLREAFKNYSLGRLSISAGIGLFPEAYPISQMAIQTGKLEDDAKSFRNSSKDALALFGTNDGFFPKGALDMEESNDHNVYLWDDFKNGVCLDKMEKLSQWFYFDDKKEGENQDKLFAGGSLLYRLFRLFSSKEEINIARLAYQISRIKPSDKHTRKLETYDDMKKTLYKWILDDESRKQATTAINLIILLNRTEKED